MKPILALTALVLFSATAATAGEVNMEMGKRLTAVCTSCHTFGAGEPNKVGPNLHGVFGRKAGSKADFMYSEGMKKQTFVWDEKRIDQWLSGPKAMVPDTKMSYPGVQKPDLRALVIAYLKVVTK